MGSGDKRKPNDSPVVRRPLKAISASFGGGAGGSSRGAEVCVSSFDVLVNESPLTREGVKAILQKNGDNYYVMIGATEVGRLRPKQSQIVDFCRGLNYAYVGKIVLRNERHYARFNRVSR